MSDSTGPSDALQALYDEHAFSSLEKQLHLSDLHGEHGWEFDLETGVLTFDEKHHYASQVLGTESHDSDTWLWAWANNASGIPAKFLKAARQMRAHGKEHGVAELTEPKVSLSVAEGHYLAIIAAGLCEAKAYYRGPYEGGALFVLITDDALPPHPQGAIVRIRSLVPQALSALPIADHRRAFEGYCKYLGVSVQAKGTSLIAEAEEGSAKATFDKLGRLTKLSAKDANGR